MRKLTVKVVMGLMVMTMLFVGMGGVAEARTTTYTVQPGDSLWRIANRHRTTVNSVKQMNNNWSDTVRAGQRLRVPVDGTTHSVRRGDTLFNIASRYGTTATALRQHNGMNSNTIRIGQVLVIPNNRPVARATTTAAHPATTTTNRAANVSNSDVDILARIIHAEARGESYQGQVAVGAVVLNRVRSSQFPNTVNGVIFQRHAFEPVANGQIWLQPSESAYRAARAALSGQDPTNGALYFYNPAKIRNPRNWIWSRRVTLRIGNHSFAI